MKARIEELAESCALAIDARSEECLSSRDTATIVRALTTLAEECYERAAKVCDRWSGAGDTQVARPLAIGIRKLKEEL